MQKLVFLLPPSQQHEFFKKFVLFQKRDRSFSKILYGDSFVVYVKTAFFNLSLDLRFRLCQLLLHQKIGNQPLRLEGRDRKVLATVFFHLAEKFTKESSIFCLNI
jgi:hypothetical protein